MAQINLVHPRILTDQHLCQEYAELPVVFLYLKRTLKSRIGFDPKKIKTTCPLGNGHIYFFYDKLGYLQKRYLTIIKEMRARGFHPDPKSRTITFTGYPKILYRDYRPSKAEKDYFKKRIITRIKRKPDKFKFRGRQLTKDYYEFFSRN